MIRKLTTNSRLVNDILAPGGQVVALNVPAGQWHTVRALESGSVILEMKNGPYEPIGPEDILAL
jgi:cupin fold WbuC family metalloprotein